MSGHKRALVSISQEEYRRLYDLEARLRHVQHDLPPAVTDLTDLARELIEDSANQVASIQLAMEQQQIDWKTELDHDNAATIDYLVEAVNHQEARLGQNFTEAIEQIEAAAADTLNRQSAAFSAALEALAGMDGRDEAEAVAAGHWIAEAEGMLGQATENLPTSLKAELVDKLELAKNNLQNGMGAPALSLAQQTLLELGNAIENFRRKKLQDAARCAKIKARWFDLLCTIQDNSSTEFENQANGNGEISLNLDQWSAGQYANLLASVEDGIAQLEAFQTLNRKEGEDWSRKLADMDSRFSQVIEDARQAIITAQRQANLAAEMLFSFQSQGFQLKQILQAAGRPGEPLRILMQDDSQTEITLSIVPAIDAKTFQMDLLTHFPHLLSEVDAEVRLEDLAQALFGQTSGHELKSAEILPTLPLNPGIMTGKTRDV